MARSGDTVRINELLLTLFISNDDVQGMETDPQPVLLSLTTAHDISRMARTDDLAYSIDYAAMCATLIKMLPKTHYTSLEALADHVFESLFRSHPEVDEANVSVTMRDTLPRFTIETTRRRDRAWTGPSGFTISGLDFPAIISVSPQERTEKQPVVFDITIHRQQRFQEPFPFLGLSTSVHHTFGPSEYLTVEALASAVACHVLEYTTCPEDKVTVKISKPNALTFAVSAQIQITRH